MCALGRHRSVGPLRARPGTYCSGTGGFCVTKTLTSKRVKSAPCQMSGLAALCRRHFPNQLHTRTCLPLLPPTSAGSPAVRPRVWVSPTSSRTPAEAWNRWPTIGANGSLLSTPEASATTRSTRAGTPPPRTPDHYPDSPQSSANVTALPAVVARRHDRAFSRKEIFDACRAT